LTSEPTREIEKLYIQVSGRKKEKDSASWQVLLELATQEMASMFI
jgi:hypothetical protein